MHMHSVEGNLIFFKIGLFQSESCLGKFFAVSGPAM